MATKRTRQTLRELMSAEPVVLDASATVGEAAQAMKPASVRRGRRADARRFARQAGPACRATRLWPFGLRDRPICA